MTTRSRQKKAEPCTPSALEAHVGYWLRAVSNHVSHSFEAKVVRHGVTVAEWVVLRALFDEAGKKPSELAETLGLTRGAVSKLVDRLVVKELVATAPDVRDGRSHLLRLLPAGRRLVPVLSALADQNDEEVFGRLDPSERAAFLRTLVALAGHHRLRAAPID